MESKDIERRYFNVCNLIYNGKVKSALDELILMVRYAPQSGLFYEVETLSGNYLNLLKYAYEGYHDPGRKEILLEISGSILNVADEIRHAINDSKLLYNKGEKLLIINEFGREPEMISQNLDQLLFSLQMRKLGKEIGTDTGSEISFDHLFRLIWLTDKLNDDLILKIRGMISSDALECYDKSQVVSSLLLSLLRYFDPRKIILLIDFIEARQHQVYQRALVGLVLSMIVYDKRISFYHDATERLVALSKDKTIREEVEAVILQFLLARETEKITQEFEEEVLPEMKKMMPKIEDKLELGNLFEEEDKEGKNPGWKEMIDEVPGLFERIEKFTRMQMEGGDVFMGTFSQLKKFDFFQKAGNWFVPYYSSHPDILNLHAEEPESLQQLMESMNHAFYICNSDKYSFILNFMNLPQQQQSMIVTHFEAELQQMKEMESEDHILGQEESSNSVFIQYIQDLYRFYKLFPFRNEFEDIFRQKIRFSSLYFYKTWFEDKTFTEKLARFYFDKNHYPEAIEVFQFLSAGITPKAEYFEKIAYSFQKLEKFHKAIEFYRKAELFDCDRLWVLKKLGFCYMKINDFENATKYLKDAVSLKPDDLRLQIQLGQCCLNLKKFDEALEYFGKVRYFQPENMKVLRPVAYCHFVIGKLAEATQFYSDILSSGSSSPYDYMNSGHVQLCLGNKQEAMNLYRQCLVTSSFSNESFSDAFEEDIPFLLQNGIQPGEIPLILDYILFQRH